jgi:hypothetical protein
MVEREAALGTQARKVIVVFTVAVISTIKMGRTWLLVSNGGAERLLGACATEKDG